MNHAEAPASARVGEHEGHTAATFARSAAAGDGRSVEIAVGVKSDAFVRFAAVGTAREVVEHGGHARRSDLKDRASAERSLLHTRAVKVAFPVGLEFTVGVLAVRGAGEAVD